MNIEDWRREDGSIALEKAYSDLYGFHSSSLQYLADVERLGAVTDLGTRQLPSKQPGLSAQFV